VWLALAFRRSPTFATTRTYREKLISYYTDMSTVVASSPFALAESPSRGELVAKYFRGLGDPTRLRIVQLLDETGELTVGEIVKHLDLPQATISTHLGCLRWCGFVATRREQRSVIYRVADQRVSELVALASSLLEDNAEHVACCQTIG
jgi:ArsR family transcriptional regulator, cadmium/lead-responsive transcriptional repressor